MFEYEGEILPTDWLPSSPAETDEIQEVTMPSDTEYRKDPAISQSFLKSNYWSPGNFTDDKYTPKHYFSIGGGVDCMLTTNEFDNQYYLSLAPTPSDSLLKVVNYLLLNELNWTDENLLAARAEFGLYPTYGDEAAIRNLSKIKDYYDEKIANKGKVALSRQQMDIIEAIVHSFKNNARTKRYFLPSTDDVKIYYQLQVYFNHNGVDLKGMLDLVVIDYVNRTIEPFDIKTTGKPVRAFTSSIQTYGYNIQAAQYTLGLQYAANNQAVLKVGNDVLDLNILGFEVKPFKFIVQTTDPRLLLSGNVSQPQIYQLDAALLVEGRFGKIAQAAPHNCDLSPSTTINDVLMVKNPGLEQMIEAFKFQKQLEAEGDPDAWVLTEREFKDYKKRGAVLIH